MQGKLNGELRKKKKKIENAEETKWRIKKKKKEIIGETIRRIKKKKIENARETKWRTKEKENRECRRN